MRKTIILLLLILVTFSYAEESSLDYLSKGRADTLYCNVDGTNCVLGGSGNGTTPVRGVAPYLYNQTIGGVVYIYFNVTTFNSNLSGLGGSSISPRAGLPPYLYNSSTHIILNETALNYTISQLVPVYSLSWTEILGAGYINYSQASAFNESNLIPTHLSNLTEDIKLGNTSIEISTVMENGTIIRSYNNSWINKYLTGTGYKNETYIQSMIASFWTGTGAVNQTIINSTLDLKMNVSGGAFTGDVSINKETPVMSVTDPTNTVTSAFASTDNDGRMGTSSNHPFLMITNNQLAFTIQTDQDLLIDTSKSILFRDQNINMSSQVDGELQIKADEKIKLETDIVNITASGKQIIINSTGIFFIT